MWDILTGKYLKRTGKLNTKQLRTGLNPTAWLLVSRTFHLKKPEKLSQGLTMSQRKA